ncbi:hypothetical protein MRB53_011102 [Persea americana]|uniref:Uncharacterized protein n=1 Tax=Persea americana TaxID=3435 RepID=A0ACC2LTV7_PERAE|nr:hypothetical protein MRB53_011102 [Persea americana]
MELVLEILTGKLFHVQIEQNATVKELKKKIAMQEALPEHRLILVLRSGPLMKEDQFSLADYGVKEGSQIYVFFTANDGTV